MFKYGDEIPPVRKTASSLVFLMVKPPFLLLVLILAIPTNAKAREKFYTVGTSGGGATSIDLPDDYVLSGPQLPREAQDSPHFFCGRFFISSPVKNLMARVSCSRLGFTDFAQQSPSEEQTLTSQKSHLNRLTSWSKRDLIVLSCPPVEQVNTGDARGWLQIINHKPRGFKTSFGGTPFKGLYDSPELGQPASCSAIACVIVGGLMIFEIEMYGPTEESTRTAFIEVIKSLHIPTPQATSEALSKQGRIECTLTLKSGASLHLRLPPGHIPDQHVDLAKGTYKLSFIEKDAALRFARADGSTSVVMWQERHQGRRHEADSLLSSPLSWFSARASNYRNALLALQRLPIPFSTQVTESDTVDVISTRLAFGKYGHDFAFVCEVVTDGGDVLHCTVAADSRAQLDEIQSNLSQAKYVRK